MANSYVEYPTSGTGTNELGQKVFAIPFKYIAIADVEVKGYNGSTWTDLTIAATDNTAKTVELSAIPSAYTKIRVWRNSSTAQLVDFQNGSRLSESDLDTAYQQGLFVAQEVSEGASTATATGASNVSLSGTTTVADLALTGNTTGLDVNGTDIILDADGDSKIEASTDDVVAIHTGGSERMCITSVGNVGIGTSSPVTFGANTHGLTLNGTASGQNITFQQGGQNKGFIYNSTNDMIFASEQTGGSLSLGSILKVDIGNTERMRIDSSGAVFIGKTGEVSTQDGFQFKQTGECIVGRGSNDTMFIFQDTNSSGATVGSISITSSNTAYNTSSDYRLKENITDISDGITRVKQLSPKRFNFIVNPDTEIVDGFIAHEVATVIPEAITGAKDDVDDDGNIKPQGIDQSKLVPLLTAALQEAIAKIEVLETKVAALEA